MVDLTDVSVLAIVTSGISAVIIGFVWYSPKIFGSTWMREINISPEKIESSKKNMPFMAIIGLFSAMIMAYVLSLLMIGMSAMHSQSEALKIALLIWGGFNAAVLISAVLWEQKSFSYYLITTGYWLVTIIAMAQIITLLG